MIGSYLRSVRTRKLEHRQARVEHQAAQLNICLTALLRRLIDRGLLTQVELDDEIARVEAEARAPSGTRRAE